MHRNGRPGVSVEIFGCCFCREKDGIEGWKGSVGAVLW